MLSRLVLVLLLTALIGAAPAMAEPLPQIEEQARAYFAASSEKRADWKFDAKLNGLLMTSEDPVRQAVWRAYQAAPIHAEVRKDFDHNQVRHEKHLSKYTVKKVGKKPAGGWPLVIAMHGGGSGPASLNDSQWRIMQRYYVDQPSVEGYLYVALRAPNDSWNGFYADYVPPLISNLIRQMLLFAEVDPDRVYLAGYSHGGYGAFFIGPKIPHRFAAVHASAGAPTDGTISARCLRNLHFTFMIGERDTMFGRRERCEKFAREIEALRTANPGAYPVAMEFIKGAGHGGLPDRGKIKDLAKERRTSCPRRITWDLTDGVVQRFYWLKVARPTAGSAIDAEVADNVIKVTTRKIEAVTLELDGRLLDLGKPVQLLVDGKKRTVKAEPKLLTLCESMLETGDPKLAWTCRFEVRPGE